MFSANVIEAIHVLLQLDEHGLDEKCDPKGVKFSVADFGCEGPFYKSILRHVLSKLSSSSYIRCIQNIPKRYILLKKPEEITMLELVMLFHGRPCIGEIYDHNLTLGPSHIHSEETRNVKNFEAKLQADLTAKLEAPISIFKTTIQNTKKVTKK